MHLKHILLLNSTVNYIFFRICGNTAKTTNIASSVSEQMRKNFIKKKWKVN